MPVFLNDDKKVLFVHVPKTGGTSIEQLFKSSGYQTRFRATPANSGAFFRLRRVSPQHMQASLLKELLRVSEFDVVFMLVRDPLARFRSEYGHRNKDDLRTDERSVEEWAEREFRAYADNPYRRDNHFRPQSEFYLEGSLVYRLEDGLENAVRDLNDRFGLGLRTTVPRAMDTHSRSGGIPSTEIKISPRLEDRLRQFYADDFKTFGY